MASIKGENLTKVYSLKSGDEEIAVDSLNFDITDKDFITIVGPSGCGKTTLLRMIAGLTEPTEGDIYFDEEQFTYVPPQKRNISMVFQDITLFPFKNVRENIEYGVKYTDMEIEERDKRINELSEVTGISDLLDKKPNQLSGGQQQRAALARALIRDPNAFLLDEPLSDLDAKLKNELRSQLIELHKEFPVTSVYVTHDQEEAMTLSDEIIVMNDGDIMQQGPPDEIYHQPQNSFVARFIGSPQINLFEANVTKDGKLSSPEFKHSIELDPELTDQVLNETSDGKCIVGIRPIDLKREGDSIIETKFRFVENLGDELVVHLSTIEDGKDITVRIPPDSLPDNPDSIGLSFSPSDAHIFDAHSGKTLTNSIITPSIIN